MASETEAERKSRYDGLQRKAEDALSKLLGAEDTPSAVRAQAIRTALELCGAIGARRQDAAPAAPQASDDFDASSMSVEDIDQEIARLGIV